jgi:light-harvesting complex 1 beta chain
VLAAAFALWQIGAVLFRARRSPQGFQSEVLTMAQSINPSGLSDDECQEFHKYYIQGYLLFAAGALFAHSLVWIWRPWF